MSLDDEIDQVRAKMRAAGDQQAAAGSTGRGVFEAQLRAALDHSIKDMARDLDKLEAALGAALDGGSFLMGMMAAAFVIQGADLTGAVGQERELFIEYIEKARQR
jgi:hypothetical protein